MKGQAIIIAVIILLFVSALVIYNKRKKSKDNADKKKADIGSGGDYNRDRDAKGTNLLDDGTVQADVKRLIDEYKHPYLNVGGKDKNMTVILAVAHSVDNQGQWSQILKEYARQNDSDLYTDVKEAMSSMLQVFPPYEEERNQAIRDLKTYISTLPTGA